MIDTVFFLLVIFMITAPLLEYTVNVSPPQLNANELKPDENTKAVNLTKDGNIVFEKRTMSGPELCSQLQSLYAANSKLSIILRADGAQKYSNVIDVMKYIKKAGLKNISLVTEAEEK